LLCDGTKRGERRRHAWGVFALRSNGESESGARERGSIYLGSLRRGWMSREKE
jgi:hypothetical protein